MIVFGADLNCVLYSSRSSVLEKPDFGVRGACAASVVHVDMLHTAFFFFHHHTAFHSIPAFCGIPIIIHSHLLYFFVCLPGLPVVCLVCCRPAGPLTVLSSSLLLLINSNKIIINLSKTTPTLLITYIQFIINNTD